jgi:hypothetical protein
MDYSCVEVKPSMNAELFAELVFSVREGGAILRGETAPSRTFVINTGIEAEEPDVQSEEGESNDTCH